MSGDVEDKFGPEAHSRGCPNHSGTNGHYCWEFDGLWICDDCTESMSCHCVERTPEQQKVIDKHRKDHDEWLSKNGIIL